MKRHLPVLSLVLLSLGGFAAADTHNAGGASAMDDSRPTRGMSEASVEARFGTPVSKVPAVGEPPISRWEYPGFIVYFEYDLVIHTVVKR